MDVDNSDSSQSDWRSQLISTLNSNVALIGVGSRLRSDDGIGPAIIDKLENRTNLKIFNCETAPENYISRIVESRPDTIVIIDSADFKAEPGTIRIFHKDKLVHTDFSTHSMSPKLLMTVLEERTQADCFLLAIQPLSVEFGLSLSKTVQKAAEEIAEVMMDSA